MRRILLAFCLLLMDPWTFMALGDAMREKQLDRHIWLETPDEECDVAEASGNGWQARAECRDWRSI